MPATCYADDLKLIVTTCPYSTADRQAQIDIVVTWSHENFNLSPFSVYAEFFTVDIKAARDFTVMKTVCFMVVLKLGIGRTERFCRVPVLI